MDLYAYSASGKLGLIGSGVERGNFKTRLPYENLDAVK
jgi:hypothetical protein